MRKLDKLIIGSFLGPFLLTLLVSVFILLTQYMLNKFDEFVGKDLGFEVFVEVIFYFCINTVPRALPLAVLLSSLITFGNLGEHFELTAIKASGISLIRVLAPLFVVVVGLTIGAFYFNDIIVPKANLKAYSVFFDVKQKKPTMDIAEGSFYQGFSNYRIKINKKFPDGETIKDIMIYDHSKDREGNTTVILADSGKMSTFGNEQYLLFELFDGKSYNESSGFQAESYRTKPISDLIREEFDYKKLVFDLKEFNLKDTPEDAFKNNRFMKNVAELNDTIRSMRKAVNQQHYLNYSESNRSFRQHLKNRLTIPALFANNRLDKGDPQRIWSEKQIIDPSDLRDSTTKSADRLSSDTIISLKGVPPKKNRAEIDSLEMEASIEYASQEVIKEAPIVAFVPDLYKKYDSATAKNDLRIISKALNASRTSYNLYKPKTDKIKQVSKELNLHKIEKQKKYTLAFSCLVMFLIGAPLGAIIKKGGLGLPVLISIIFYLLLYILGNSGQKWGREGVMDPILGTWLANIILLPIGLFFLRQARNDARILETDFYLVIWEKVKTMFLKIFRRTS